MKLSTRDAEEKCFEEFCSKIISKQTIQVPADVNTLIKFRVPQTTEAVLTN